jgi:hypothetical protein
MRSSGLFQHSAKYRLRVLVFSSPSGTALAFCTPRSALWPNYSCEPICSGFNTSSYSGVCYNERMLQRTHATTNTYYNELMLQRTHATTNECYNEHRWRNEREEILSADVARACACRVGTSRFDYSVSHHVQVYEFPSEFSYRNLVGISLLSHTFYVTCYKRHANGHQPKSRFTIPCSH